MTTTDFSPPPDSPPNSARVLRRSTTDRVGAGVAGGLGTYFGVDPVLFRVFFAVAAFFGGAGIVAYLIAWAVIPEAGSGRAGIDSWIAALRRHRVPVWLAAVGAGLLLWLVSFSWWMPWRAFPVVVVVALIVVATLRPGRAAPVTPPGPVSLSKEQPPQWREDGRAWLAEAKAVSRERRRRSWPLRVGTILALVVALVIVGIVDAVGRVAIPVYFWTAAAVLGAGLLIGLVTRRTPWSVLPLLVLALAGGIALAPTSASWSDGVGSRTWAPTSAPAGSYRLAIGQATLDLRKLPAQTSPQTVHVSVAVGQVRVFVPHDLPVTVNSRVRFGAVTGSGPVASGIAVDRPVTFRGTGRPVTVDVQVTDGNVEVVRF